MREGSGILPSGRLPSAFRIGDPPSVVRLAGRARSLVSSGWPIEAIALGHIPSLASPFVDSEGRLPIERELRLRLEAFGGDERVELLRILESTEEDVYLPIETVSTGTHPDEMTEFLRYLERDPAARGIVITELRIMNRQDD